ncbi:hypothetical protein ACHAQA_009551 [Verticillium albo-atrum]
MELKKLNGTLYPPKHQSPARARPNNASDEIWTEWEWARIIPVTAEEVRKMGKDESTMVKLEDEEWGLGDDAYAATFDIYHQLHCVNMLRENIFKEYYGRHPPKIDLDGPETVFEIHMSHCLDILMQAIQCSGNLHMNTWHWVADEQVPFPDMSINRQCFDLDQLTEWRLENSVDLDQALKMKRPEGVKSLPGPDGYYKLMNVTNPNHINGANPDEDFNL